MPGSMGCTNCSKGNGKPAGCRSNGYCASDGCEKLEVFDWLADVSFPSGSNAFDKVEVRFKNGRKGFFQGLNERKHQLGEIVVVSGNQGYDVGTVSLSGELVRTQMARKNVAPDARDLGKVLRTATEEDVTTWHQSREREKETMMRARTLALACNLKMKISDVEYQGDGKRATFYYTADNRVDFRELIRKMADAFKVRIEMRQIGSRQESARLGGIGSCGRELCCSTWLTDFRTVSTSAARYQQLSINPQKLAGQCGKLKCCLNYELDMYLDAIKDFPSSKTRLSTGSGKAFHIKTDIFKRTMWFALEGQQGGELIPLHVDRVKEIIAMNKAGKVPAQLVAKTALPKVKEPFHVNVVGEDRLDRFDKKGGGKKRRPKRRKPRKNNDRKKEQ